MENFTGQLIIAKNEWDEFGIDIDDVVWEPAPADGEIAIHGRFGRSYKADDVLVEFFVPKFKTGPKNPSGSSAAREDYSVKASEQEIVELKARITDMGKGYELLKKQKAELENEVENLKAQILNLEKQLYKESGKSGAYEFVISKMFRSGKE